MSAVELLAPAKDLETGIAAIDCGADAVYVGATRFGARAAAGNSLADIAALARHAHRYWARVYAAVNTILRDDELDEAVRLCHDLAAAGVDGLIIQDVGLLECDLPPLPLIASTQMHNHTPARVAFLEKVGFARAILARELDLDGIRAIRAQTGIELEVFVHGALCVGMSGRCTLSYAIGGRSGNRGQCAQPCRRAYSLVDGAGRTVVAERHLLSLRDLNLTPHLHDLIDAGVSSFKIEGRLKNKAYVMNVVGHYRRAIDQVLQVLVGKDNRKSSSGRVTLDFQPNPDKTFNRGYTTYFLQGRGAEVASPASPKHVGEPLGNVQSVGRDSFMLDTSPPLQSGDGITFFARDDQLEGSVVNRVAGQKIYPQKLAGLRPGARVFRNHDHAFAAEIARSRPSRKLAVDIVLGETATGLLATARDEDGISANATLDCAKVPAEKPDRAAADVTQRLARLGDTEFAARQVELAWTTPLHLAPSQVNGLRRALADNLAAARAQARPTPRKTIVASDVPFPEPSLTFHDNVLNQKARAFYRRHQVRDIEPAAESGLAMRGRVLMTTRYCLKYERGLCPRAPRPDAGAAIPEPWFLVDDEGRKLRLRFCCAERACVMEIIYEG